uniref:Uncharacterized protein n=1 Tax=Sphaerodactylus townsendi TaxID=933632 RepID=A0ACB8GDD9_9SAUR
MERSMLCRCGSPPVEAPQGRICCKSPPGSEGFWRPWIDAPKNAGRQRLQNHSALSSLPEITEDLAKFTQYTHPVRCFDYLYQEAEALLRNFPVQATISFYEDSESEEENDDMEHDTQQQN